MKPGSEEDTTLPFMVVLKHLAPVYKEKIHKTVGSNLNHVQLPS